MPSRFLYILFLGFILLTILVRLTPHAPNMTPVGALALMAGVMLRGRWSWILPVGILGITDVILGGYALPVMLAVYGSFALVALIGRALQGTPRTEQVIIGSCGASLLFFITTNFAVWAWTPLYEKTWNGLLLAYTMAVPFYRNMLVGDLFYTTVFVAVVAAAQYSVRIFKYLNHESGIMNQGFYNS